VYQLESERALILVLSNLGVPDKVFMRLPRSGLTSLFQMFVNEDVTRLKLEEIDCGIDWRLAFQSYLPFSSDPYLRSYLVAL